MTIQINLEVRDVSTVLEGLGRVIEHVSAVHNSVRDQANAQLIAQQEEANKAQQANQPAPPEDSGASADAPQA